jgi:bifunctional non-homologous end joining protein LigD
VIAGVTVSNAEKVWWPEDGITKGDVARFYDSIRPLLSPWLRDRPLTAERCPDGMLGSCFYQKDFPEGKQPHGVPRFALHATSTGKDVRYLVGGLRRLPVAMVSLGCISLHVMNARVDDIRAPDWLAFDLDPSSGTFADAARAGRVLRGLLEELGLVSYPKTSGSRGLHVFVPLRRRYTADEVTAFGSRLGAELASRAPDLVTVEHAKTARGSRVYADAFRNAFAQTIVTPYSVRRRPHAPVSTPLEWDEVTPRLDPARFNVRTFVRTRRGEPWKDFWRRRQSLPRLP